MLEFAVFCVCVTHKFTVALATIVAKMDKRIKIVDYVEAQPTELLVAVRAQHLEGIVGKRKDSLYQPGKRTGAWIKFRVNCGQELVIGGYVPGRTWTRLHNCWLLSLQRFYLRRSRA